MLSTDTASAGFAIDEATHTIRFVRDLDATPARVFAAWTEPEQARAVVGCDRREARGLRDRPAAGRRVPVRDEPSSGQAVHRRLFRNRASHVAGLRSQRREGQGHARGTSRGDAHDDGDRLPLTRSSGAVRGDGRRGRHEPDARQPREPSSQSVDASDIADAARPMVRRTLHAAARVATQPYVRDAETVTMIRCSCPTAKTCSEHPQASQSKLNAGLLPASSPTAPNVWDGRKPDMRAVRREPLQATHSGPQPSS